MKCETSKDCQELFLSNCSGCPVIARDYFLCVSCSHVLPRRDSFKLSFHKSGSMNIGICHDCAKQVAEDLLGPNPYKEDS